MSKVSRLMHSHEHQSLQTVDAMLLSNCHQISSMTRKECKDGDVRLKRNMQADKQAKQPGFRQQAEAPHALMQFIPSEHPFLPLSRSQCKAVESSGSSPAAEQATEGRMAPLHVFVSWVRMQTCRRTPCRRPLGATEASLSQSPHIRR